MMLCNDDFTLIMWLVQLIQQLLSGVDPWDVWKMLTDAVQVCGRTEWA